MPGHAPWPVRADVFRGFRSEVGGCDGRVRSAKLVDVPLAELVLGQAALDQRPHFGRHLIKAGEPWTSRYSSAAVVPAPNGPSPVAAKASTAPRLNMSLGCPTSQPVACSGDTNAGEPIARPARVSAVDSAAREMPENPPHTAAAKLAELTGILRDSGER